MAISAVLGPGQITARGQLTGHPLRLRVLWRMVAGSDLVVFDGVDIARQTAQPRNRGTPLRQRSEILVSRGLHTKSTAIHR